LGAAEIRHFAAAGQDKQVQPSLLPGVRKLPVPLGTRGVIV